jgi:hypothetical protein
MLHAIASAFIGAVAFIGSLFGVYQQPEFVAPPLGASLPSGTAVFETSLQSRISSTDTSLTLVANSVRGGSSLSGFQCFTVDEGRTDAEYVCGTVSGTSVTSLTRGVDPSTGTSSNSALKFAHRVGANIKITDFPLLQILRNQANGTETYPAALKYATGVAPSTVDDLTDKAYVDSLAFNGAGVIDASSIAKGVVELATGAEAAASTPTGGSGTLVLPASLSTSTYNSATAANRVIVTGGSGKIDNYFIASSSLFAYTFPDASGSASTTLVNNGSGVVTWDPYSTIIKTPAPNTATVSNGTSTVFATTIPGGTLSTRNAVRLSIHGYTTTQSGSPCRWDVGYSNSTTSISFVKGSAGAQSAEAMFYYFLQGNGSVSSQRSLFTVGTSSLPYTYSTSTLAINSAINQPLTVMLNSLDTNSACSADMVLIETLRG